MTIVDVRKLTRAEICKLGSNIAAQIDSDRRRTHAPYRPNGAPSDSPITKRKEAIACLI
jgi:hypothetical protein